MDQNKAMKLWTAVITAFLALCTALGLITTTAAAAVPQAEQTRNSTSAQLTTPALSHGVWSHARSLPPTMKQRIRAEAHGKTPSGRNRPLDETSTDADADASTDTNTGEVKDSAALAAPATPATLELR
ncbi:DUF6344 domain-containing protein [Streptomyces fulvoviolaceus]|uniref:DUF6344 domain-containing protein n=1 Tax=Streptomyces fulvoviolaceus TaxID=285535 RepID=UPI0021BE7B8B|nr:DUF6344 domain-containing protein [Streptomyces fulvoviolaceus]MCT9081269.1 DUF6344 domain-containing protein [Streptomyces fulvoviolaceus]